jgi:predicted negative regulator of RcsB-dependent stress response
MSFIKNKYVIWAAVAVAAFLGWKWWQKRKAAAAAPATTGAAAAAASK